MASPKRSLRQQLLWQLTVLGLHPAAIPSRAYRGDEQVQTYYNNTSRIEAANIRKTASIEAVAPRFGTCCRRSGDA